MVWILNLKPKISFQSSISSKIRWIFFSFTMLLSLFFVFMLLAYSWVVEDNIFNRLVAEEAHYIENTYDQLGIVSAPRPAFMKLYSSWMELPDHIQLLYQQSPDRVEFPLTNDGTLHVYSLQLGLNKMVLAADVSAYEVSKDYLPKTSLLVSNGCHCGEYVGILNCTLCLTHRS